MTTTAASTQHTERSRFQRDLWFWLLIIPVVMGSLFLCGELAMFLGASDQPVDTRSLLNASYLPWPFQEIQALQVASLQADIRKDQGDAAVLPGDNMTTGNFWPLGTATPVILPGLVSTATPAPPVSATTTATSAPVTTLTPSPTNTATRPAATMAVTDTLTSTSTATPTRLYVSPTPTGTATPTRVVVVGSPTTKPTATWVVVIITKTPTPTDAPPEPTTPPTFTPTPTFTQVPTIVVVTTVPPYAPVRPVPENSGNADPDPADATACIAFFGYKNDNPYEVTIPFGGPNNRIDQPYDFIQSSTDYTDVPSVFFVPSGGRYTGAFGVRWRTGTSITWSLDGGDATFGWCR